MKNKISLLTVFFGFLSSFFLLSDGVAHADSYVQTFTISAYYSPLPCQDSYAMGSYEADIRMNGNGTHGADGTPVYPGMVAAPKTYAFGTKMHIPGIGNVAVHDRGGAIVPAGQRNQAYDRLDIWMGYGDEGLRRALNWGKRNVDVVVYGDDPSVEEQIHLYGYDISESIPKECVMEDTTTERVVVASAAPAAPVVEPEVVEAVAPAVPYFYVGLTRGSSGAEVERLQNELKSLNFYWGEIHGEFDEVTEHAVYKFQQSQGVIGSWEDAGAGYFGPTTRDRMNEIVANRVYSRQMIAAATEEYNEPDSSMLAKADITPGNVF